MLCRPSTPLTPVLPPPSPDWPSYLASHHGWVVARLYTQQVVPGTHVLDIAAEVGVALEAIRSASNIYGDGDLSSIIQAIDSKPELCAEDWVLCAGGGVRGHPCGPHHGGGH